MKYNKIGDIIKIDGVLLEVIPAVDECEGCSFKNKDCLSVGMIGNCIENLRKDSTSVIFKKLS